MRCSPRASPSTTSSSPGRTHLQDATPIRLGQEFTAYSHTVRRHRDKLAQAADWLREMNIGGTAVGTGINAEPDYPRLMVGHLRQVSGLELREGAGPDPADAVHGRHRLLQRGAPGLRARPEQDRQRHPAARLRPAHRPGRDRPARGAAGIEHHAGEGEPLDRRDGESGLLPGAGPRPDGGAGGGGRPARAQRHDAGDHPQHRLRAHDRGQRQPGLRRAVRGRHRGGCGAVRLLAGAEPRAGHRPRPEDRLCRGGQAGQGGGQQRAHGESSCWRRKSCCPRRSWNRSWTFVP